MRVYAELHGDARALVLGEPALGNAPPVAWRGSVISQDLANCAPEGDVEAIGRAVGDEQTTTSNLEIGGGHKRAARERGQRGGTVFLKQWDTWHNPADDVEMRFDDYPVPAAWQFRFKEVSPVQTRFVQAAWQA